MAQNQIIKHNKVEHFLGSADSKAFSNLIFIHGEQYLQKQALDSISLFLLGSNHDKFALETLEGGSVTMGEIIEQVSTFSFSLSRKVILVKKIPLFQSKTKTNEIVFSQSELDHFMDFIEKGIPENHYLILTANLVDKRKKIFKEIKNKALIIDCQVASGSRKADIDEQRAVLQTIARKVLSRADKNLEPRAFTSLVDLTGFDLELFSRNLEKLIVYTGKNPNITNADVKKVISRDKTDPIFNLTNALMEKDTEKTLFYFNSLLNKGFHILQLLRSMENQIRKLILVKCCAQQISRSKTLGIKKMGFNVFKQSILPKIVEYDKKTKRDIKELNESFLNHDSKKKTKQNELLLAPNPKNAYPVFQTFQKSENFSQKELNQALIFLSDMDYKMKSSSFNEKTALENFVINICSKEGFIHAQQN
ncbi:MAG: DNA polymerase III subunit delta [Deltaproteobacteria bacterium]|jgi:DNA polymerase III delta subunit|nr:DNA polymerase III subunit delta [Deltaproteobacteria bacterium]